MSASEGNNLGKLPPCVLNRMFEYLFWVGMCDNDMNIFTSIPLGHRTILPALQVNHSWRKRAARMFYGFVIIIVGCGHTTQWEIPTRYHKNLALRTNVQLILESGYAPKATGLVIYSNSPVQPIQMALSLDRTGFLDYVWEKIHTLYFFHPHGLEEAMSAGLWDQDQGVAQINDFLAQSLPSMTRIKALSNTRDSFGLFALDDLINARLDHVSELVVLSHGSLILGAQEFSNDLQKLVIRTTLGVNRERNADDSHFDSDSRSEEMVFAGSEDNPADSDTSSIVSSSIGGAASSYSSSHLSQHIRSRSASSNGSAQFGNVAALRIPRICAESLVFLELGPISPDNIWDPFTLGTPTTQALQTSLAMNTLSLKFSNLKTLKLVFSSPLLTNSEEKHRRIHDHHRHQRPHWSSHRRSSAASDNNSSIKEIQALFPSLESLSLTAYPHDIVDFLDAFPCAQLQKLEFIRCPHNFFQLTFEGTFDNLVQAHVDIPRSRHGSKDRDIEDWISKTLGSHLLCLQSLSMAAPPDYTRRVELPVEYRATNIHHLRLNTGLRLIEIEKLLAGLPNLRTIDVTVTEIMGKTHEYLSRTAHRKKYSAGKWKWRRDCQQVLSISLEEIIVRYVDLSHARLKRAVSKTVVVASRVPSILRISTQPLYLDMLCDCINQVVNDKSSMLETHHLSSINLASIVGID